ncbi:unnamed protein product, partial [Rotaria sordida]
MNQPVAVRSFHTKR